MPPGYVTVELAGAFTCSGIVAFTGGDEEDDEEEDDDEDDEEEEL